MRRKRTVKPNRYRTAGIVLSLVIVAFASLAVVADQWQRTVDGVRIEIKGAKIVDENEIRKIAAVSKSANLAELDLLDIKRRIEKNPFVKDAELYRDPPGTLLVEIKERNPVALLMNISARDWLIDEDGYILPTVRSEAVRDLPLISGGEFLQNLAAGTRVTDSRIQHALKILYTTSLLGQGMTDLFSEVNLGQKQDLILYTLEGGIPVIFGNATDAEKKLRSFRAYWENIALKEDIRQLEYIDLRFKDRITVRWRNNEDIPMQPAASDSLVISSE